jgi:hypothetical protein
MKPALLYILNFTNLYINLRYSLAELYVKSVYLNLFGWRGRDVHEKCWGVGWRRLLQFETSATVHRSRVDTRKKASLAAMQGSASANDVRYYPT